MRSKDLTAETIDAFGWLEFELGYNKDVSQYHNYNAAKKITYKKGCVTIALICANMYKELSFEIFVATKGGGMSIQEPKLSGDFYESDYADEGYQNIEYDCIFNYTKDIFDKKQFQRLKNEAELQLKKRDGRKRYVEVFSQLIKAALPAIEAATNPPTT